ncbi:hypothetical protein Ciccas_011685 [Cichlidogyrus casuarinus]|uniref:Uncharacterized protein n=1 Tax=Cichlidogyrus casuarinus TaxID=1844966 RepID=A0ABD2PQJ2_9PLAT
MLRTGSLLLVALLFLAQDTVAKQNVNSTEKKLVSMLMRRYEELGMIGRPIGNSSSSMTVKFGLSLIQVLDMDENKQILRTNTWWTFEWHDSLLVWNKEKYAGITQIHFFPKTIWKPDIGLYNFADERHTERRDARVIVNNDGSVTWIPQALLKSSCLVDFLNFPFDIQFCALKFGSWTYDITQLDFEWIKERQAIEYSEYVVSNEWYTDGDIVKKDPNNTNYKLMRSVRQLQQRTLKVANKEIKKNFRVLLFIIKLRRNFQFYLFTLIIPSLLLSSLTTVVFWLPPESPAKMMLGMNIFVAFFVLLILLSESMPKALKHFPLLGQYFCLNMMMITISTFLATLIINLYNMGPNSGHLPKLLRRIVVDGLGRMFRVRQFVPLPDEGSLKALLLTESTKEEIETLEMGGVPQLRLELTSNEQKSQPVPSDATSLEENVRELKRVIRLYVNRQREKTRKNLISMEWRTFALVLDRLFFVIYVFIIVVWSCTVALLWEANPQLPEEFARNNTDPYIHFSELPTES